MRHQPKKRKHTCWVDVGSHGLPFVFDMGPVADRYPQLLHVYNVPGDGRIEAVLTFEWPNKAESKS